MNGDNTLNCTYPQKPLTRRSWWVFPTSPEPCHELSSQPARNTTTSFKFHQSSYGHFLKHLMSHLIKEINPDGHKIITYMQHTEWCFQSSAASFVLTQALTTHINDPLDRVDHIPLVRSRAASCSCAATPWFGCRNCRGERRHRCHTRPGRWPCLAALGAPYTAPFTGGGEERRRPLPMVVAMAHMLLSWMRPSRS